MKNTSQTLSAKAKKKAAILSGTSLVLMAIAAGFSFGFVYTKIIVAGDWALTEKNLIENSNLFVAGLLGWGIIFTCDVLVSIYLFRFFKDTNHKGALWMSGLRLIYTAILGVAICYLGRLACVDVNGASELLVTRFNTFWSVGLIVFGFHLVLLGALALRAKEVRSFWGVLLIVAGLSYVFVHLGKNTSFMEVGALTMVENILSIPMTLGEVGFAIWLLVFGFKKAKGDLRA